MRMASAHPTSDVVVDTVVRAHRVKVPPATAAQFAARISKLCRRESFAEGVCSKQLRDAIVDGLRGSAGIVLHGPVQARAVGRAHGRFLVTEKHCEAHAPGAASTHASTYGVMVLAHRAHIFALHVPTATASGHFLQSFLDPRKNNGLVMREIHPLLCAPTPVVAKRWGVPQSIEVCVTHRNYVKTRLTVSAANLLLSGKLLRQFKSGGRGTAGDEQKAILAQTDKFTLRMRLAGGAYQLALHSTRGTRDCVQRPLVTMTHGCHHLDHVLERVCDPTGTLHTEHGVLGMLTVTQELLRRNMVSCPVRSEGPQPLCERDTYCNMTAGEIQAALHSMHLITDCRNTRAALDRLHAGVRLVERSAQPGAPAGDHVCRLHHTHSLSYAIAHQNQALTGMLTKKHNMDMRTVATTLYSGVAFCQSLKYETGSDDAAAAGDAAAVVHVINEHDIPGAQHASVLAGVQERVARTMQSDTARWSKIRNNFVISDPLQVDADTRTAHDVECHVCDDGTCMFRRAGTAWNATFAVFCGPHKLAQATGAAAAEVASWPKNPAQKAMASTCSHPVVQQLRRLNSIVHAVSTGASQQTPTMNETERASVFMRASVQSLAHLNAICIQNRERMQPHHSMLRRAWLHSNCLRAARIFNGERDANYLTMAARLANVAALPLHSVGFWDTVPYM